MKPNLKSLLAVAMIASVIVLSSCGKDDGPSKSKTVLLTQHTWKYSSSSTGNSTLDLLFQEFNADLNNTELKFNADNTFTYADPAYPDDNTAGPWEFANNETELVIFKGTADEEIFKIATLNESTFAYIMHFGAQQIEFEDLDIEIPGVDFSKGIDVTITYTKK